MGHDSDVFDLQASHRGSRPGAGSELYSGHCAISALAACALACTYLATNLRNRAGPHERAQLPGNATPLEVADQLPYGAAEVAVAGRRWPASCLWYRGGFAVCCVCGRTGYAANTQVQVSPGPNQSHQTSTKAKSQHQPQIPQLPSPPLHFKIPMSRWKHGLLVRSLPLSSLSPCRRAPLHKPQSQEKSPLTVPLQPANSAVCPRASSANPHSSRFLLVAEVPMSTGVLIEKKKKYN